MLSSSNNCTSINSIISSNSSNIVSSLTENLLHDHSNTNSNSSKDSNATNPSCPESSIKNKFADYKGNYCSNCLTTHTPLWRRDQLTGNILCNACALYYRLNKVKRPVKKNNVKTLVLTNEELEIDIKGTCEGNGNCNGTGGKSSCKGCPTLINQKSNTITNHSSHNNSSKIINCFNCKTDKTPIWRKDDLGNPLCNACGLYYKQKKRHRPVNLLKKHVIKRRIRHKPNNPGCVFHNNNLINYSSTNNDQKVTNNSSNNNSYHENTSLINSTSYDFNLTKFAASRSYNANIIAEKKSIVGALDLAVSNDFKNVSSDSKVFNSQVYDNVIIKNEYNNYENDVEDLMNFNLNDTRTMIYKANETNVQCLNELEYFMKKRIKLEQQIHLLNKVLMETNKKIQEINSAPKTVLRNENNSNNAYSNSRIYVSRSNKIQDLLTDYRIDENYE